jgi:hypothetical protein
MKPRTKRQKGNSFELEIAKSLRDAGLDKEGKRMPLSGAMYGFESDVFTRLPISIECKRQETTKFSEWYRQAESEVSSSKMPVVVWRENNGQPFAFLKWSSLLEIMAYALQGGWIDKLPFGKPKKYER